MDVKHDRKGYKRIKKNYVNFFLGTAWILIGGFRFIDDKKLGRLSDILFMVVGIAYLIYGMVVWRRQE